MRALLMVIVLVACGSDEKPTPAQEKRMREAYARSLQDSMRDQSYGASFTVKAIGDDAKTLEIGFQTCDRKFLEDLVAAPKVQRALNEFTFYKVQCASKYTGAPSVTYPWTYD